MEAAETITEEETRALREAVYNGTEEPAPDTSAADTDEVKAAQTGEPETIEEDPWAGVPSALRTQIESITGKLSFIESSLEGRVKQLERRTGAIQNDFYNAQKAAEEARKQNQPAPTKAEIEKASESDEDWQELERDFPGWAKAIDKRISAVKQNAGAVNDVLAKVNQISDKIAGLQENAVTKKGMQLELLSSAHPDWQMVISTPEYQSWLQSQPQDIRYKAEHGDTAREASEVLNLFKANRQKATTTAASNVQDIAAARARRVEKAVDHTDSVRAKPQRSEADLSDAEYRKQYAKELWGK